MPWKAELEFMKVQARAAGAIMRRFYKGDFRVFTKPDRSKVTEVDLKISEMLQKTVPEAFPGVILYSEESETGPIDRNRDHFVIDELDGTSYFIEEHQGFSHQAAFYKAGKGLVVGLVYYPIDDILLYAMRGHGAFLEHQGEVKALAARQQSKPSHSLRFAQPARYRGDKYRQLLGSIGVDSDRIVKTTARRTLQFVQGELDVALFLMRRIPEWDWAGEKVVLEELGFSHTYLDGRPIEFGKEPASDNPGYLICHPDHRPRLMQQALAWLD